MGVFRAQTMRSFVSVVHSPGEHGFGVGLVTHDHHHKTHSPSTAINSHQHSTIASPSSASSTITQSNGSTCTQPLHQSTMKAVRFLMISTSFGRSFRDSPQQAAVHLPRVPRHHSSILQFGCCRARRGRDRQ
jgi:hypothetical protein